MFKYKNPILIVLLLFFLFFSFYPTLYEISQSPKLKIKNRDFILEHNYYWPDFNLYLSKVRQGYENRWLAVEKYTSEPHRGSIIQIFYLYLGKIGSILKIEPNYAYQLGRIIFSPLLLIIILLLITFYFRNPLWQILAFIITIISGSFPNIVVTNGQMQISRYMEWWSNIDSLQRLAFIPHILFGQVVSFYLLYKLTINRPTTNDQRLKTLFFYILLANATGLVFPPSLITLLGVLILLEIINFIKKKYIIRNIPPQRDPASGGTLYLILFSLPALLYLFFTTKFLPWSALVNFHRNHPMMVPLDQYILGTGPIIFLGFLGSILAIMNRKRQYYPLILWIVVTFLFASLFSVVKEQSPLRFTQTGLFIPLGILGSYLLLEIWRFIKFRNLYKFCYLLFVICYLLINLFIMKTSLKWQLSFINQRIGADIPLVPYPPQTMYPLTGWMEAIRWLRHNTPNDQVILAEITAGNYIPAYSGNYVYFGQSDTVDYNRKTSEVDQFFLGQMSASQAQLFLQNGRIKYIFFGPQEKEKLNYNLLEKLYPFINLIYSNPHVFIYSVSR